MLSPKEPRQGQGYNIFATNSAVIIAILISGKNYLVIIGKKAVKGHLG